MLYQPTEGRPTVAILEGGVKFSKRDIGPKDAQEILGEQNGHNRTMRMSEAQNLAEAWERNEYVQTGDTIKFDRDGWLIDGQHRLQAVILSGMTRTFIVVTGLEPDAIEVIDVQVAKRTLADILKIRGFSNTAALAAVVNGTYAMEQYGRPYRSGPEGQTTTQSLDLIERRPSLVPTAKESMSMARGSSFTAREFGTMWDICSMTHPGLAVDFFDQVSNGYGEKGSPAVLLKKRADAHVSHPLHDRSMRYMMAIFVLAWNAVVEGRKPRSLKWETKDGFPEMNDIEVWRAAGGVTL
jgi:hypothetical protein